MHTELLAKPWKVAVRALFGIFSCNKDQGLINLNAVFCHQPRCTNPGAPLHSDKFPFIRTFCLSY